MFPQRGHPISRSFQQLTRRWSFGTTGGRGLVFKFWPEIVPVSIVGADAADGGGTNTISANATAVVAEYLELFIRNQTRGLLVHAIRGAWTDTVRDIFRASVRSGDPPAMPAFSIRSLKPLTTDQEARSQVSNLGIATDQSEFPVWKDTAPGFGQFEWRPERPVAVSPTEYFFFVSPFVATANTRIHLSVDFSEGN